MNSKALGGGGHCLDLRGALKKCFVLSGENSIKQLKNLSDFIFLHIAHFIEPYNAFVNWISVRFYETGCTYVHQSEKSFSKINIFLGGHKLINKKKVINKLCTSKFQ